MRVGRRAPLRFGAKGRLSMPNPSPIAASPGSLDAVRFDAFGLVPAVVQELDTGIVLMLGYMNQESLRRTLTTGRTWFWSRSRSEYWCKGETSGDRQWVRGAFYDCDGDALLIVVEQEGRGACHVGERTCFYRSFADPGPDPDSAGQSEGVGPE